MDSDGEEEDEVGLPVSSVLRVARSALPASFSMAKEVQQALPGACEQFVKLVTAEMVEKADREDRKVCWGRQAERWKWFCSKKG